MKKLTSKAYDTIKLIKETQFLERDLHKAIKQAASWTADDMEDEKRIAEEITKAIFREFL